MILKQSKQLETEYLASTSFDIFFAASGFESRAIHLAKSFNPSAAKKICIGFLEHTENPIRRSNDIFFAEFGFSFISCSGNSCDAIRSLLNKEINIVEKKEVNILVDYSCMTRIWYAEILSFFRLLDIDEKKVSITFSYSHPCFVAAPHENIYNKYVSPIHGFYSLSAPIKPTALVVGLGYIENRAFGLSEFFDVEPILFITDSTSNKEFFHEVLRNNSKLISAVRPENIFSYPLKNMAFTEALIYNIIKELKENYRVILAPCGPKPFTLLCLITSIRNEEVDVWRISAGENETPVDKPADGHVTVYQTSFS